ncbi:hypothetical protein IJM16_00610 [Candidatus Saccharibacteria bacterium]|nr:hypothetical protein [Candidatus Saccharibacteria bacterium]
MSRIFKISGNFKQFGEWMEPDPAFSGEIVVDEKTNEFYGYCHELYAEGVLKSYRLRFIVGAFAPNARNGNQGIAFYKLSNDLNIDPYMYVTPDLTNPESGEWSALGIFGIYFERVDKSRVMIEEMAYSKEEEKRIKSTYEKIDRNRKANKVMLDQVHCCKDILLHAK